MKSKRLLDIVGDIDDKYIAEAAPGSKKSRKRPAWVKWTAAAACMVLLVSACLGSFAVAAEAEEYKAAIQFFDDYGMSTEGLTRSEIKAVYRDITTKSFTYSKTAEVIKNSVFSDKVGGYDIEQSEPTPEDIENLWDNKTNTIADGKKGIRYKCRSEDKMDAKRGFKVHDKSYIEKYDGEELIWSVSVSEFWIAGHTVVSDGVIIYGHPFVYSSEESYDTWLAKVDDNGNFAWKHTLKNGLCHESISAVVENDDGSYAVFSWGYDESIAGDRREQHCFCFRQYASDGKEILYRKTVGGFAVWHVVRFGDGYIMMTPSNNIIKVDREGNITDSFSYDDENANYGIMDMIEFNGKIYLSANAYPHPTDEVKSKYGNWVIGPILHYLRDKGVTDGNDITSEELTPVMRDSTTAVLLVCDPDSGKPQEFYSVKGSFGGKLSVSDTGKLIWDVKSITTAFYSPMTSSYLFYGDCYMFKYTFDDSGKLISQEKTGEVVPYWR